MSQKQELEDKIKEFKEKFVPKRQRFVNNSSFTVVNELVANIFLGAFIGYHADKYFHSKGLLILLFIIFGLISFLYNVNKKLK